jgi:hypothetical protein
MKPPYSVVWVFWIEKRWWVIEDGFLREGSHFYYQVI